MSSPATHRSTHHEDKTLDAFACSTEQLAQLHHAQTWQDLAPGLHVHDPAFWHSKAGPLALDAATLEDWQDLVIHEGYFHAPPPDWQLPIPDMAYLVHTLRQLQLPPVFALVYDEFWLLFLKMAPVLAHLLGDDYAMLPNLWVWHVDPAAAESGWLPHRDIGRAALYEDGRPKAMTVWLPLTEATPSNGCMYLVPADRDPTYNTPDEMNLRFQLPDIRALPAVAGSMLAWTQAVLHWGARAAPRHLQPRISIGAEFQRGDIPAFSQPLLNPGAMPGFEQRLQIIAQQIRRYKHHHAGDKTLAFLASHFLP